jgi:hypothetical protein
MIILSEVNHKPKLGENFSIHFMKCSKEHASDTVKRISRFLGISIPHAIRLFLISS